MDITLNETEVGLLIRYHNDQAEAATLKACDMYNRSQFVPDKPPFSSESDIRYEDGVFRPSEYWHEKFTEWQAHSISHRVRARKLREEFYG